MILISVLPNLEGTKYLFGDVTLTHTVPIWGVLPHGDSVDDIADGMIVQLGLPDSPQRAGWMLLVGSIHGRNPQTLLSRQTVSPANPSLFSRQPIHPMFLVSNFFASNSIHPFHFFLSSQSILFFSPANPSHFFTFHLFATSWINPSHFSIFLPTNIAIYPIFPLSEFLPGAQLHTALKFNCW